MATARGVRYKATWKSSLGVEIRTHCSDQSDETGAADSSVVRVF